MRWYRVAGSSEIRKYKEISDFLFFLPIWFIQHNQAILSLDTACPSPCIGQSLVMGSLDKKVFLQAVRHKELEQNEMFGRIIFYSLCFKLKRDVLRNVCLSLHYPKE